MTSHAPDTIEPPTHTEMVYGNLLVRHMQAMRTSDESLRVWIWDAIELFEELWPEDCERWRIRFDKTASKP